MKNLHWLRQKLVSRYRWHRLEIRDFFLALFSWQPKVLSITDTINNVHSKKLSVSRFGDGELNLICGASLHFQKYDSRLAKKMEDILAAPHDNLMVCIPNAFSRKSRKEMCKVDRSFWKSHLMYSRKKWLSRLNKSHFYGNTFMSRIYSFNWNKDRSQKIYLQLEKMWAERNMIIIEGAQSRLGVGNDCFKKASSIQRILAPATNSFDQYDSILAKAIEVAGPDTLFVLAMGPTATVMAADLANAGHQAIDLGHIDIEYEWMRMGCKTKQPVPGKYTNEAFLTGTAAAEITGQLPAEVMAEYQSQVIADFS